MADTVEVSGECPPWLGPARGHHSLRWIMHFPRGVGPALWDPCGATGFQEDVGSDPSQFTDWQ